MRTSIIKGNQNTTKLISELKTAAKQYKPLNKEQEEALIAANKHDREKLNYLLYMHNIRLVFNIAKKYVSKTDDFDSLVQDGMLGLSIAVKNFDINRGTKFITYATPWIRKKILERFYNRSNEVIKRSISLNSPSSGAGTKINDDGKSEFEDYVNDYIDPSINPIKTFRQQLSANEQAEICADLYKDLECNAEMNDVEKKIFYDMFYNKEKSRDIQLKYDVTAKDIATIKSKILMHMKDRLESKYGIHSFSDIYDI